jgi:phosphoribosylformylglycinamidine cyclo-ligase
VLGPERVQHGDVVVAIASSGLHSNGFSLVRSILAQREVGYDDSVDEFGGPIGLSLLEPTRLYTKQLVRLIDDLPDAVHALSHVTGGGIAANLARVLPHGSWVELDRSTWSPQPVFRVLAEWGGLSLDETEGTWNLGVGMIAVVAADAASSVTHALTASGLPAWVAGRVTVGALESADGFVQGAKGVDGGAVRLVGSFGG